MHPRCRCSGGTGGGGGGAGGKKKQLPPGFSNGTGKCWKKIEDNKKEESKKRDHARKEESERWGRGDFTVSILQA